MIQITHIPRAPALARFFLALLVMLVALAGPVRVAAQSTAPDVVCLGATKHYWVTDNPGSTYEWTIEGVTQPSTTFEIYITWNTLGDFTLTVKETTAQNCPGQIRSLPVHVFNDPPGFIVPELATGYCVEDIHQATYNPGGTYYVNDISPPRPDYYLLTQGNTLLDITGITDDCPGQLTISWVIHFANGPPPPDLTGTGQISLAIPPEGIQFPVGNNVITWTVTDAAGSTTVHSVTFVVLPRPDIGDIPP